MGKSYVENSLKRFLKRKVKITMGFVVTFLITGAVSFAADETVGINEYHQKYNLDGILTAKDNLTGLGKGNIILTDKAGQYAKDNITIKDNVITIKKSNGNTEELKIDKSLLSTTMANNVSNVLSKMEETNTKENNNKILESSQNVSTGTGNNNGVILFKGANGQIGSIINNYGIIANDGIYGQNSTNIAKNNGIIINKGNTGQISENIAENYGVIANIGNYGQKGKVISNYGIIKNNGNFGQVVNDNIEGIGYNYGIIANTGDEGLYVTKGKAYNYGIIANTGNAGLHLNGDGEICNYGLIANNGTFSISQYSATGGGKAQNYGIIKNKTGMVFYGKVDNYGLVILEDKELQTDGLGSGENKGIILDKDYNVIGEDTKVFKSGETVESFGEKNTFGESITKGYVKNASVNIDNTQGKVIGAVVTEKLDKAVFNYSGDDLFLKDTSLVGYFETNGTLLDVGTGNLTLRGDTNITAVKNDLSLDVTAVQLGENGKITIMDSAKINGIIKGGQNSKITFTQAKGTFDIDNRNGKVAINIAEGGTNKYQNYFDVTLTSSSQDENGDSVQNNTVGEIGISTENGVENLTNKLVIDSSVTVGKNANGNSIYDANTKNDKAELELDIADMKSITGKISLGVGKDTVIVNNTDNADHTQKEINLGAGEDKFVVNGYAKDEKGESKNIFSYNVVNAETIELQGGTWGDWNEAKGTIGFTDSTKAGKQPNLVLGNDTTMNITLNAEGNHGSDFANYVGTKLGLDHAVITGTGNNSSVKYLIDEKGLDTANLSTKKYSFGDGVSYKDSPIFNISSTKEDGVNISVKTAGEMGLSGQDRIIYEAYLDQIKVGNANKDVIEQLNKDFNTSEEFANHIRKTNITGETYYTAGSVVTMDIADTYLSGVEDFTKRAGKGEWFAQGKYINSDTEFDGGSKVKGYDGDVTGTVGMIEYGFTENTSYGIVYGQGDSEMDIDGGGKLDGDNIYAGLYMKHRTQNGIELVANLGYVENDMDSVLRNDFKFDNGISSTGKTFEKGTADSSAVILSVKGRKDYRITDTVKVQPILGARAAFINQEEAENPEMHFTIKEQDIIVVEGTAGMGIAKEFALPQGKLELNAGVEYTFAATSSTNDAEYTLFDKTTVKLEDVDTAENTGTAFAGFDYEHESGVGFNGKYEMMWSDKGDDSRITAGISYRF